MWVKVRRVGIISAFKLGCFMSALPTLIILLVIVSGLFSLIPARYGFGPGNVIVALPVLLLIALATAIGPAITLAFQAFIFNLFGRFFGGVALRLDRQVLEEEERLVDARPTRKVKEDPILEQIRARREKMRP